MPNVLYETRGLGIVNFPLFTMMDAVLVTEMLLHLFSTVFFQRKLSQREEEDNSRKKQIT